MPVLGPRRAHPLIPLLILPIACPDCALVRHTIFVFESISQHAHTIFTLALILVAFLLLLLALHMFAPLSTSPTLPSPLLSEKTKSARLLTAAPA